MVKADASAFDHSATVVFDPETITDTATYAKPVQHPTGIRAVLVNGQPVVEDGKLTGALPGRVLRHC